jgi:hypothetical protein
VILRLGDEPMKRREFITLLGGAAAWPISSRAQDLNEKAPRIGFLQRVQNENVVHLSRSCIISGT